MKNITRFKKQININGIITIKEYRRKTESEEWELIVMRHHRLILEKSTKGFVIEGIDWCTGSKIKEIIKWTKCGELEFLDERIAVGTSSRYKNIFEILDI